MRLPRHLDVLDEYPYTPDTLLSEQNCRLSHGAREPGFSETGPLPRLLKAGVIGAILITGTHPPKDLFTGGTNVESWPPRFLEEFDGCGARARCKGRTARFGFARRSGARATAPRGFFQRL